MTNQGLPQYKCCNGIFKKFSFEDFGIKCIHAFAVLLNMFNSNTNKAIEEFIRYHKEYSNEDFLDIYETRKIRNSEAISIIKDLCNVDQSTDIQNLDKDVRDKHLIELKNRGLSTRQIARLTGIGRSIVMKL